MKVNKNLSTSVYKKHTRTFLGINNYYKQFIPNLAALASLLTDPIKGENAMFNNWAPDAEKAFQNLKQAFCQEPVLAA